MRLRDGVGGGGGGRGGLDLDPGHVYGISRI